MDARIVIGALAMMLLLAAKASSQWLPEYIQAKERKLIDATGVEIPEGMRFYKVKMVGQRIASTTFPPNHSGDFHGIHDATVGGENGLHRTLWQTPGGLTWAPRSQWRNATAGYIPKKGVNVYREQTEVFNGSNNQTATKMSWQFPDGTAFLDSLIRTYADGSEAVFEVRIREKQGGKWDSVAYRPFAEEDELPEGTKSFVQRLSMDRVTSGMIDVRLKHLPPGTKAFRWSSFSPTRKTMAATATDDDSLVPKYYYGNMVACAKCHEQAGDASGYGGICAPGSDTIISWHPFTMATLNTDAYPQIDRRWPIKKD